MPQVRVFKDELTVQRQTKFDDIPVDVSMSYEGERIRKQDMYVEFGGVKVQHKFELFRVVPEENVEDGKIVLIGPDLNEFPEGAAHQPLGIIVEAAGKELKPEAEGVFERKLHYYMNWIQGIMHTGSRDDIWIRVSKKAVKAGLRFEHIGKVIMRLYKADFPIIEKIQVTFITDPQEVEKAHAEAVKIYRARDERVMGIREEDVDVFYGCVLCQSFAPTHVCVITPERPANCGAITWIDAKVAAMLDPKGPIFPIPKGNCIDPIGGEYEGVNEVVKVKSQGTVTSVKLHSVFENPHTSCGCFEAIVFYIPEVDGFGIVSRKYTGNTPIGLNFIQIANMISGGKQVSGFVGIGLLYLRSRKFLQKEGGWNRVVWMDSYTKERAREWIPKEILDKIPTEKEVQTVDQLKEFLVKVGHPITKLWAEAGIEVAAPAQAQAPAAEAKPAVEAKVEMKAEVKPAAEAKPETAPPPPPPPPKPEAKPEVAPPAPKPVEAKPEAKPEATAPMAVPFMTVSPEEAAKYGLPVLPFPISITLQNVRVKISKVIIKKGDTVERR
ncbi:MAG: CO dehydrogenase/CO-methylating acetyl-CoA synthase complex subunit beta [Crenarchaeota archaeon]|nr:CO dehydrogenase/CO-methylating acetyl-CoA synthase complex subunit beta [Thermoproteota archaeon]